MSARARASIVRLLLTLVLALTLAVPALAASPAPAPAASGTSLKVSPSEGEVGSEITVSGAGFTPGTSFELVWETAAATVTAEGNMYAGRKVTPRTETLAWIRPEADGSFSYKFKVPEDYGGMHNIVARAGQTALAQAGIRVWPRLSILAKAGPVGTPIRLVGDGFGLGMTDSQFHVIYDNRYMGLFSGVTNKGKVALTLPAAGGLGLHRIDIYPNYYGPAYLNNHDGFAEYANVPRWNWDFTVTSETPQAGPAAQAGRFVSNRVAGPEPALPAGPPLTLSPTQGPVGDPFTATAAGFRPGETVELVWQTLTGAYIQSGGFGYEDKVLAKATADANGKVVFSLQVPPDAGAWHPVLARGESQTAVGKFGVVRAAFISPLSGPPGTQIHIRLTGVGWRSWENNTAVTWNNAYTGYACALGPEKGSINVYLTAVGDPGTQVIGLWPAIFRGPASVNYGGREPDNQRLPVLAPEDLPEYIEPVTFTFNLLAQEPTAGAAGAAGATVVPAPGQAGGAAAQASAPAGAAAPATTRAADPATGIQYGMWAVAGAAFLGLVLGAGIAGGLYLRRTRNG